MTTATPNSVSGQWVANFTVPALPRGSNLVEVINNGVIYEYDICIVPTLILTPSTGPIGTTVTVTAYGFSPTNSKHPVVLYWFQESWNDGLNYWLANTTVGINGAFNETGPVQFVVPLSYGGAHNVTASDLCFGKCKAGGSTGSIPIDDVLGLAVFTVTPAFVICKASTCGTGLTNADTISVNANTRTTLMATGTGFGFTCGSPIAYCAAYQVNIDNALYSDFSTYASDSGSLYVNFTAAGFSPGLHQVDLYGCESDACVGAPDAVAYFNVTTIGAYSSSGLTSNATSEINSIYANVNTILGWGTTITTISTNVNTILGWGTTITTISTNVNTILGWGTTITGINTNVNGLASTLATIQGTLTTIQGTLTTIQGTLTTLTADVNSATSAATGAQTAAQAANTAATNGKNSVSDTETYVLVVAVLAAITLVLELAILVRKLD